MNVREYNEKEENDRTFEKICLEFKYNYKNKEHKILLTAPRINKKYEKNDMLKDRMLYKFQKHLYNILICDKKIDYKSINLYKMIHWIYLAGYDCVKVKDDYKFINDDFMHVYNLYSVRENNFSKSGFILS